MEYGEKKTSMKYTMYNIHNPTTQKQLAASILTPVCPSRPFSHVCVY